MEDLMKSASYGCYSV